MQNNFYEQLKLFLRKLDMEKAYKDSDFYLCLIEDVANFLLNKSDDEKKLVIDGLYNNAIQFKKIVRGWSYHPLTKWLQDRQNKSQKISIKTIISKKDANKQYRLRKKYRSLDELVNKEYLDEIVKKLQNNGYINRSEKNEIRFIDPPLKANKALIRRLVIVGVIIMENYLKTTCSDNELWIALTTYFNVTGNYQSFKRSERVYAEYYRQELEFLIPNRS